MAWQHGGAEATSLQNKFDAIHLNASVRYEREAKVRDEHHAYFADVLVTKRFATIPSKLNDEDIENILDWYRREGSESAPILYYTNSTPPSPRFESRLLATGVSTNWKAKWMWLDLDDPRVFEHSEGTSFEVLTSVTLALKDEEDDDRINARTCELYPNEFCRLVAMRGHVTLGACVLNTIKDIEIAGLFDMFVESNERRKGIGTALTIQALEIAKHKGCKSVFLNSTPDGELLYRKVGFRTLLDGTTWHLVADFTGKPVPRNELVQFLQAVALADIPRMESLHSQLTINERQDPTINGMTHLQIAVYFKRPASAKWLIDHGAKPDVLSLWDVGMKDEVCSLVKGHPEAMNVLDHERKATPLHIAVERDDLQLATMLVDAGCELSVKDGAFGATALGWAQFLGRPKLKEVLEAKGKHEA